MEERPQDELEKLFQSNLNDIEVSPSEKVWKDIEKRLDKKPGKRFFWIFFFPGVLLIIGGGSYGLYKSELLKSNPEIVVNNNSNKENQSNTKNTEVKNSPDSKLYYNADKNKKNNQSVNDKDKPAPEQDKASIAGNKDLNSNQNSNISTSLSKENREIKQTNNKKKADANISALNEQAVSIETNSTSRYESADNTPGNKRNSNSKNTITEFSPFSERSSKKIDNPETIIVRNQNDEIIKNTSVHAEENTDQGKNNEEKILNKDQAITKTEPVIDAIRKNETNVNVPQDTQPAGKNAVVLKDQNPIIVADTTFSKPDSLKHEEENIAVLAKDSTVKNKKEKKISKYSVAVFYSPDMNKPFLSDRAVDNSNDPCHFKNVSNPQNSFSEGLMMGYDQTNRIRWQAGVSYTELTQSTETAAFKFNWHDNLSFNFNNSFGSLQLNSTQFDKNDNSSGYPSDTIHIRYDTKETLGYIKLPVVFNYKLITGRFSVYTVASITGIVQIKNQMEFHVLNASSGKVISSDMSGIRKMNIGFMGGLGGQVNIFRGLYIFAEPNLKTSLFAINRRTSVRYIPFSLSISVGFGFHF
ncbi:MAG TPA: hypothetical protein VNW99_03425 [Cytophagaceae bacterium]|nr:hypothetical protein [Cytophagaceae bacterium]